MKERKTKRGFSVVDFKDHYNHDCSLQKSSLATEDCVWLGYYDHRMHLTREQVKELLNEAK